MKTCFKCGRTLPLGEFYRHPMMGDGHLGKCKDCTRTDVSLNRLVRQDYYIAYDKIRQNRPDRVVARRRRNRSEDGRIDRATRTIAFRMNHPEKYRAHYVVHNAVRDGRLERRPCEVCGRARAQAHHDDYSMPLSVRWLCRKHHMEHHLGKAS